MQSKWTFDPPLQPAQILGTVTIHRDRTCVVEGVPGVVTDSTDETLGYGGSCLMAMTLNFNGSYGPPLVLGGAVYTYVDTVNNATYEEVLVPDQVCNTSTATGTGVLVET